MKFQNILCTPLHEKKVVGDIHLLIDPDLPNWIATGEKGARILGYVNGRRNFEEIVSKYAKDSGLDFGKAWTDCHTLIGDAVRSGFVSDKKFKRESYPGRGKLIKPRELSELWIHVSNACNLSCQHCLVSAAPGGEEGISTEEWRRVIKDALKLGVKRFFITGGEPLMRDDIFELLGTMVKGGAEIVILTNGTLLKGSILKRLVKLGPEKVKIQVSLDGSSPKTNDKIRGKGSFKSAVEGIKNAVKAGFKPTISTTLMCINADDVPNITKLASKLGVEYHHLLFSHQRGRAAEAKDFSSPPASKVVEIVEKAIIASQGTDVVVDNFEFAKYNVGSTRGIKRDLSNMAYESLCVYFDGKVYPSAALAGHAPLEMGDASQLKDVWLNSKIAKDIRNISLIKKEKCSDCYLRFICGGGDLEHAYTHSLNGQNAGNLLGHDPLCQLNEDLIIKAMHFMAKDRSSMINSGFDSPVIYHSMGEGNFVEDKGGISVVTSSSNCVLFMDLEKSRKKVRDFYGEAAKNPSEDLCCASGYSRGDTSHIPKEVLEVAYGCGSPISWAELSREETLVDLGHGGGIDCFIAAKEVGKKGRVFGIDMTDEMLKRANKSKPKVVKNLGYDNVEFKKGYLEDIPLPDDTANVVISNCVINLSPDKKQVFSEIFRVLKNHGRAVISDTISDTGIPDNMKANPRLWGECVSGALTEEEYLAYLERAGFYGLSILDKTFWKEVGGYKFYSAIIRGYKFDKDSDCKFMGHKAVYKGPFKATIDEEGHFYPRNEPVEVCTDTAEKLKNPPYGDYFNIIEPGKPLNFIGLGNE
ncbi:MAG: methyltransferase domain-containing protein [Candidatus Hydrothermarchaeaceae archaeon]